MTPLPPSNIKKKLSFVLCNARSICNKFNLISNYLQSNTNVDMLFLTETWLKSRHTDAMFCPPGFDVIRFDRVNRRGGGVMLLHKNCLRVKRCDVRYPPDSNFELICVDVFLSKSPFRFCCVYSPPLASLTAQNSREITSLCKTLEPLILSDNPTYIIGDFNFPGIDWNTPSTSDPSHAIFLDFCSSNSLTQVITYPTHDKGNTLDLVLCNLPANNILLNHHSAAVPWHTDHLLISSQVSYDDSEQKKSITNSDNVSFPNYKVADYDKINEIFSNYNWEFIHSLTDFQTIYDRFCNVITSVIDEFVPHTRRRSKKKSKQPPHIRKLLKEKLALYRNSKLDPTLKSSYRDASKAYDSAVNKWQDKIASNLCANPNSKKLYGFVNSKLKGKQSIPPLECDDGSLLFSDCEKASFLNSSFQKFFTSDNNTQFVTTAPHHKMPFTEISSSDVIKACKKMKKKLSRTPEGIPSLFIMNTIPSLVKPLTLIFNLSLKNNVIPSQWKNAFVVPIFKKGDRQQAGNYRPISLTSSFSRLFEAVLLDKMMSYVENHSLITEHQFGFLPQRSSCSNLLASLNNWLQSYDASQPMNVVYTDIKKAFDSVNHRILIQVLHAYGINVMVVDWIQNFLSNRYQRVCLNNSTSTPLSVLSGVPQGSVIGPFLFLLFINGVSSCPSPNVSISLFADDSKAYSSSPDDLQQTLDDMSTWLTERQLLLAPQKCMLLKIGKNSITNDSTYTIDNHPVQEWPSVKDLGVFISHDLKWSFHVDHICHNASIISYQLRKTVKSKNIWTWMDLFTTFIRPKLEYCSPVWCPYLIGDVDKIENIQRRYTKFVFKKCSIPFSSYMDRLQKIDFITLEQRRKFLDLILIYKIIHGLSDLKFHNYFSFTTTPYSLRSHSFKIKTIISLDSSQSFNSFFGRVPPIWNKLPEQVVCSASLGIFKKSLKAHFKN